MTYDEALAGLNAAQRKAVEHIEGPVMVVAGPGTGKTQLLSLRVGSILRRDGGMLPGNILCLTFTDSAAANLRERLVAIGLGQDAYQVAIHTFNSFGSWVMNSYPEYFFAWREAATADELTSYRLIETILEQLPGNHPLAAQGFDGSFFALKQLQNFIGDCKRANVRADDVRAVLAANEQTYAAFETILNERWPASTRSKTAAADIAACIAALDALEPAPLAAANLTPVAALILQDLHAAAAEAETLPPASQSKPFTAWKNRWLELDASKHLVFSARKNQAKLLAAADVYEQYQQALEQQSLVDFNDQIMLVLAALEQHEALRLNLQERFQYIMIDEYQDTNRAQLQMAHFLTDASVHGGRPNILVVGDDDQAIYRFQGADMSNIAAFKAAYREPEIIALTDNYRSNAEILKTARAIATQIALSLEKQSGVSKELTVHVEPKGADAGAHLHVFAHESEHYAWIAEEIKKMMEQGTAGSDIAVLARTRSQLDALVPYLRAQTIAIDYERRENVLEQKHVQVVLQLARLVQALHADELDDANAMLPDILAHPMWGIAPADLWRLAREAHASQALWFDVIFAQEASTPAHRAAEFLLRLSQQAANLPLEQLLDRLLGIAAQDEIDVEPADSSSDANDAETTLSISPFKQFYFGQELLDRHPAEYLTLLSHLTCLLRHVRAHQQSSSSVLHLEDLIAFVDAYQHAGLTMTDTAAHREDTSAVRLMTVHKAKGQEFGAVFVIGLEDDVWSGNARSTSRFSYPRNMAEIKPSDNDADDALRLLFVALTRARQALHVCAFRQDENGKTHQPFAPLLALPLEADAPAPAQTAQKIVEQYESNWLTRHASVDGATKQALLGPTLETYQLSVTHLVNFLDVTRGGPLLFLTEHLLGFPSATSPNAAFGIAVHRTLRRAHELIANGERPTVAQLLGHFDAEIARQPLSIHDFAQFKQRGDEHLQAYFEHELGQFASSQKSEVDFAHEGVTVGEARLKGVLDRMDFDPIAKTIEVSDYKTGARPYGKWELPPSAAEFERIKLHHYRQQLLFYKLLVDGAADWGKRGWRASRGLLRFVEPDAYGHVRTLALDYDDAELEHLIQLIQAVWQKIMQLDFPDTSTRYEQSLQGIESFEQDLIDGLI